MELAVILAEPEETEEFWLLRGLKMAMTAETVRMAREGLLLFIVSQAVNHLIGI